MNKITALGALGSKSEKGGSTCFLLNEGHAIDAGNLLLTLLDKSVALDTIWLTHSHLDHIIDIAYIVDNYYDTRTKTLKIYGLKATLEAVQKHFFNDKIWPDFSKIPLCKGEGMTISYHPIETGKVYEIGYNETVEAFPTNHSVPSCGYVVQKSGSTVIITADTATLDTMISYLDDHKQVKTLVVECSFPSRMERLAIESKHLTPKLLFEELEPLDAQKYHVYINHLKPSHEDEIYQELEEMRGDWEITVLKDGDEIHF